MTVVGDRDKPSRSPGSRSENPPPGRVLGRGQAKRAGGEFVGREPELDILSSLLLEAAGLITLVGPGGVGKSRLAAEAVRRYRRAMSVPVYWVPFDTLGSDADTEAVEQAIGQAVLGLDSFESPHWDTVLATLTRADAVRDLQTVLVLDNCERVVSAAGHVVADLLGNVPGLSVLATSREALGWIDEHLVKVPALTRNQALTLFLQRAQLEGRAIGADADVDFASEICRRAENNPLYILLAAARLRYRSLSGVLGEMSGGTNDQRMRWTHGPRVGAKEWHRGIADSIARSYLLCSDKEQLLLRRMSVFAASTYANPADPSDSPQLPHGAEAEAIEAVCSDGTTGEAAADRTTVLTAEEIEPLLERLVDRSMVIAHVTPNETRYGLLECVRIFADKQLAERSEEDPTRLALRHRIYYRDAVLRAYDAWTTHRELELLDWTRASWVNIEIAITGCRSSDGDLTTGLDILNSLIRVRAPIPRTALPELRRWAEHALSVSLESAQQPDELRMSAYALLSELALDDGQIAESERILQHWLEVYRAEKEGDLPAPVEFAWARVLLASGRGNHLHTMFARAREKFCATEDHPGAARAELFEALAATLFGSAQSALEASQRHLDRAIASGAERAISSAQMVRALAVCRHGTPSEALGVTESLLPRQLAVGDPWSAVWTAHVRMWALARTLAQGATADEVDAELSPAQATEVASLAGWCQVARSMIDLGVSMDGTVSEEITRAIDAARNVLGDSTFQIARERGARLRLGAGEAHPFASETPQTDSSPDSRTKSGATPWDRLTTAERDVAILAAAGYTNTAVAARRGSSHKTVGAQMTAIFEKLAITSRKRIIDFVPDIYLDKLHEELARQSAHQRRR